MPHFSEDLPLKYERIRQGLPSWIDSLVSLDRLPAARQPLARALLSLEVTTIDELRALLPH